MLTRHVTVDPNDAVTTHDRVHRIGLLRERRGIRGRDLRAGEVVEAALAVRVAVDVQAMTVGLERLRFAVMFAARFQ